MAAIFLFISATTTMGGSVKRSMMFSTAVIAAILLLAACKPRTKKTEQEKYLNEAMAFIRLDDSTKRIAYSTMPNEKRNAIDSILKSYENATETIVSKERNMIFNVDVTVETSFENGRLRQQIARFENGTIAFAYYPVNDGNIVDSTIFFYPAGHIYSRSIRPTHSVNWIYEKFHENGEMLSKQFPGITKTWDEKGNLASDFIVENDEVVKRIFYYPNGMKKKELQWKSDRLHGPTREWDSLGTLVRSEKYKNGVMMK